MIMQFLITCTTMLLFLHLGKAGVIEWVIYGTTLM